MKKIIIALSVVVLVSQGFTNSKKEIENKSVSKHSNKEIIQDAKKGKDTYTKVCSACHQLTGAGIPGAFPPLAASDFLNKDVNRAIKTVLNGLTGEVVVNGTKFNSAMPAQGTLSDKDIADVLTYVYASWGNTKKVVTPAMVKAQRK